MIYRSPHEKKHRRLVRLRTLAIVIVGFVVAMLLDFPLLHLFYFDHTRAITEHDWYRFLRVLGFLGTWGVVAIVFILHDRNRHRGAAIFLSTLAAGAIAELLKLIFARERPVDGNEIQPGLYHFRGLFSGFADGSNLGLPSSHAAVAFAGCLTLAAFIPNTRRFLIVLAIGTAITRMLTGAHFTSDVYLGAIIGWLVSLYFIKLTPTPDRL
jgi:membrane-associated phospholipid phosphatase